mgnify:FL=1
MNKFTFTKENYLKIAKGAGIAVGGALLTYLAQFISETDFGQWTPVVVALGGIIINSGREFLKK